ncbi:invasion protein IalB [Pseudoxanthomonas sp. SORGH_AS 997]|uniref:Invasion protein IalB n=2 Tax=Lysobacteraceae TaxID=32033 RepID=A0AAW8GC46_9GAMM|nr:invasion protein IalB [Pseudoxanthomonas winnipegensis]MDQ1132342.1 invasion protein IalB [Pseudoxanthomonas winnipegensis]MDR6137645.1 invasion protein IalB [Pseudoxanthomonas sp. SORGH_AS_0997]
MKTSTSMVCVSVLAFAMAAFADPAFAQTSVSTPKAASASPQAPVQPLPAVQRFGAWSIGCRDEQGQRYCTLAQELRRTTDNQRLLLMEVKPDGMRHASAGLTLPFGLDVHAGVSLQIDDGPVGNAPYQTCLQQGCTVPLNLDDSALQALRRAKMLKVVAPIASGGAATFQLSLQGFDAAYAQMVTMASAAAAQKTAR